MRKPPAVAIWLLNKMPHAELAGDLLEEFRGGRSRAWFWRQTVAAIGTGLWQNARGSRIFLAGVSLGFTAESVAIYLLMRSGYWNQMWKWAIPAALLFVPFMYSKTVRFKVMDFLFVTALFEDEETGPLFGRFQLVFFAGLYFLLFLIFSSLLFPFSSVPEIAIVNSYWFVRIASKGFLEEADVVLDSDTGEVE